MSHHLRSRILVASGAAVAAVLAPLPVVAGVSLASNTNVLASALSGLAAPTGNNSTEAEAPPTAQAPAADSSSPPPGASVTPQSKLTQPAVATPAPVSAVAITNGPRDKPRVAITLDADLSGHTLARIQSGSLPPQVNTPVLDYLEASGTPATVFVTGLWAQQYPDTMTRLAENPQYELANHSWDHSAWTFGCYGLPTVQDDPAAQVVDTAEVIKSYTGRYPTFFRFPGLCHNQAHVEFVADLGERTVDYDLVGSDAFARNPSAVAQSLLSQVQNGSIIVLHLNGAPNAPLTAEILAELVPGLESLGLEPVTMTELMR